MFKKIIYLTVLINFFAFFSYADTIKEINVIGNKRISKDTIIIFSDLNLGDNISDELLNDSLKELYSTKFFENISIKNDKGYLTISVLELPIIQEIKIKGIKAERIVDLLKENISLKEKNPFSENEVAKDAKRITNILKNSGYYFVKIETQIENNNNETVNLIFDIDQGEKATISKIKFVGDKIFKDRKLFSVITSEEDKFWKFISKGKYLDIERINLDKRLLKNYYREKGFYNVIIQDAYSQLINKNDFILTFNINAGEIFYFGDFVLNLPEDFDPNKFKDLNKIFSNLKNERYDFKQIENILDEVENISLLENYEFISADIKEDIDKNKVNFTFNIVETDNFYVNKIDILGNNITSEEFIRDNLYVDEGDPFNEILHNKSLNKLRGSRIFKSVKSKILSSDEDNNKIIQIEIEEKPTGEIMAGAGYGTDGTSFTVGIKENNFNGKGIKLGTNLSLSEDAIKGSFSYTHPNFAYSDRAVTTSLESTSTDKLKDNGYKSSLNQFSLGTRYEQFDKLFFSPSFTISDERVETTSSASAAYKKQEGSYFETTFGYGLTYDKRNSSYQPTSGFVSNWNQSLPIISDNGSIFNSYSITSYKEFADNLVLSTGVLARSINSITDNDVRVSQRLFIPSNRLRGFERGKVGPVDGTDFVGGNYVATFNASSTIPYFLETAENLDLKVFLDAGNVWGVDYASNVDDSNKIRSSTGIALDILTPVGPFSLSYAEAITKASTDKTESFRFQLGTTF